MSQHVSKTCNESNGVWLPIIEYSVKTGVSLSTIRRKIKSNSIQYRLDKGRYLILFNSMNDETQNPSSIVSTPVAGGIPNDIHRWQDQPLTHLSRQFQELKGGAYSMDTQPDGAPFVERAVTMVSDAFEHAIMEKEARIRQLERSNKALEERVSELKLLIRVLEDKYKVRY